MVGAMQSTDFLPFPDLVQAAINLLTCRRPVYHSEADFQFELAWEIARLDSSVEIRLERPLRLPGAPTINLDVLLLRDGEAFPLELKYITARLEVVVAGEQFVLKGQGAQDLRRYDVFRDVSRVETLLENGVARQGMSVTITNDRTMWSDAPAIGRVDEAYRLHPGREVTGELVWASHAAAGTIRGRETPIVLRGKHTLNWVPYSKVEAPKNGEFRMLLLEVSTCQPSSIQTEQAQQE